MNDKIVIDEFFDEFCVLALERVSRKIASELFKGSREEEKLKEKMAEGVFNYCKLIDNDLLYTLKMCNNEDEFDDKHKQMCENLLACLKKAFNNEEIENPFIGDINIGESLGCAQRIINLTYKQLYSYSFISNGIASFDTKITYLHCVLDSNVIRELKNMDDIYNEENKAFLDTEWSQIKMENYDEYLKVQKTLRKKCLKEGTYPLKWELETFF